MFMSKFRFGHSTLILLVIDVDGQVSLSFLYSTEGKKWGFFVLQIVKSVILGNLNCLDYFMPQIHCFELNRTPQPEHNFSRYL